MYLIRKIRAGVVAASLIATAQGSAQVPSPPAPALPPLVVTQLDERQPLSDLDNPRPMTITIVEATPLPDLLFMLVRDTRLSVVPDPDVQGAFRGELKDVTLRQALEMILQPYGFDYSVQGNVIRVFRKRVETRRFDLNYVVTRRSGVRTLSASNAIGASGVNDTGADAVERRQGTSAEVVSADQGDIFTDVTAGVQTLLSSEGRFNVDRKAALLQVTDYPERLNQVQLYLEAVQNRATRQVRIQAKVIEVALSDEFAAGIDWSLVIKRAGDSVSMTQPAGPSSSSPVAGLKVNDFIGLLDALASQGKVNVMASPSVNALNNEPAIMRVGTQDVFFKTTTQLDAVTGRILQTTIEPQSITEGVVLSVTPQIAGDGMINMSITPSLTERTGQARSRFGDTVPILSVREADTLVRVHDNDTIVIAGLMEELPRPEERKVPLLGDLPGIGGVFRSQTTTRQKTDLVILLTPTLITPARVVRSDPQGPQRVP